MPDIDITRLEAEERLKQHVERVRRNILRLLQQKKMTQKELAERMDKHHSYLQYILHDPLPNPTTDALGRMAFVLEIDITELLTH